MIYSLRFASIIALAARGCSPVGAVYIEKHDVVGDTARILSQMPDCNDVSCDYNHFPRIPVENSIDGSGRALAEAGSSDSARALSPLEECADVSCDYDQFPDVVPNSVVDPSSRRILTAGSFRGTVSQDRRRLVSTVLDFEGIGNLVPVGNFYASSGAVFSPNAFAIVDSDAGNGAGSGNFGGLPSPDTGLFWFSGNGITVDTPAGFTYGVSFWYSAVFQTPTVFIYDGPGGTGNVLATKVLSLTPNSGAPDPTGVFSPLIFDCILFEGTAVSVVFASSPNQLILDDITCGVDMPPGWHD